VLLVYHYCVIHYDVSAQIFVVEYY